MFRFRGVPMFTKAQLVLLGLSWGWAFKKAGEDTPSLLGLYVGGMMLGAHVGLATVQALYVYSQFVPVIRHYGIWVMGILVALVIRELFIFSGQAFWATTGQGWFIGVVMLAVLGLMLTSVDAQWSAIKRRHGLFAR
jgi:hypothetical protein